MKYNNHDYQNTQTYFNFGCDFLVTSKDFKNIPVSQDIDSRGIFRLQWEFNNV